MSDFLLKLHRANGVDVRLNAALVKLEDHPGDANRLRATFADGSTLDADFAVAGIGLAPHTAIAQAAGVRVEDGIVVDHFGATDDPRIFACGDVASSERVVEAPRASRIVGQRAEPGDFYRQGVARHVRTVR